ncbi:ABC transporter substrate-binding protein [Clostridium sp. CCUG 7971]|uniref:ABC transporter substrate-binding protein n=1 Tax=Clostridium sp. CCUG 7971 TaxID=2811414 RepID=UPI001ABB4169|nr:ABC transporter substrate-binding protein [Clostridium sp. CCUG 7971]MBO3445222.1 ABC transporter substrate-binding protein [Clostridium sp. CCUG 7971]
MKKIITLVLCMFITISLVGCSNKETKSSENILNNNYEEILESAKGSSVNFYGYGGDEVMNKWFDTYVIPQMKEKYDITVKRVGMDIDNILNQLLSEKQASSKGVIDLVWINGENFKTAKENDLLFGPFTAKLPNFNNYIDGESKDITTDFGTSVDGMEAPWGKAQFAIVKNSSKVPQKMANTQNLKEIVKKYPGKFTYPALPDFTGSAFVRNVIYDIVGYEKVKNLPEDEAKVKEVIQPAIDYLNEIKPYLWNKGKTYPQTSSQLDNMYSDNEVYFNMTYSPNGVLNRIKSGEFSKDTEILEFDKGNISNTHFLAIPKNSQNQVGAMVLADFLMSIDAQSSKSDSKNWGDATVLDIEKMTKEEKSKFSKSIIIENSLPELKAGLVPIIEKIWIKEVLESGK